MLRQNFEGAARRKLQSGVSIDCQLAVATRSRWGEYGELFTRLKIGFRRMGLVCGLVACCVCGCERTDSQRPAETNFTVAEGASHRARDDRDTTRAEHDDIVIPEGTPDELFAFIARLDDEPLPDEPAERTNAIIVRMNKRAKACDAIVSQSTSPEVQLSAVRTKLDALRTLALVDPDNSRERFIKYVDQLIHGNDPLLARVARAEAFRWTVQQYVGGETGDPDAVLAELKKLLADEHADPSLLMTVRDTIHMLVPQRDNELTDEQVRQRLALAARGYRMLGERFVGFDEPNVADEARGMLTLADQIELELLGALVRTGDEAAVQRIVEKLKQMFARTERHGNELAFAIQTAQMFEFDGILQPALQVYELAWRNSKDAELTEEDRNQIEQTFERATIRLNLIGKPFSLTGKLATGDQFDWTKYQGKYVVVSFWESWIQGWQDELARLKETVDRYRMKGIDIEFVTVNLDPPDKLEEYLANHTLDVPVVVAGSAGSSGVSSAMAARYGADALPFSLLIGPDGKVLRIHVFGPNLDRALSELTGS